jgi:hypothetical protein
MINSRPPWKVVMRQPRYFLDPIARTVKTRPKRSVILAASQPRMTRRRTGRLYSILPSISRLGGTTAVAVLREAGLTFFGSAVTADFPCHLPLHRLQPIPAPRDRAWSFAAAGWSANPEAALVPAGRRVAAMRTHEMRGTASQRRADARTRRSVS